MVNRGIEKYKGRRRKLLIKDRHIIINEEMNKNKDKRRK